MVEISREQFAEVPEESQIEMLFAAVSRLEVSQRECCDKLDILMKSPWRMAIPPVSWKYLGLFSLAMAAIIKGDVTLFSKLLSAIFGVM